MIISINALAQIFACLSNTLFLTVLASFRSAQWNSGNAVNTLRSYRDPPEDVFSVQLPANSGAVHLCYEYDPSPIWPKCSKHAGLNESSLGIIIIIIIIITALLLLWYMFHMCSHFLLTFSPHDVKEHILHEMMLSRVPFCSIIFVWYVPQEDANAVVHFEWHDTSWKKTSSPFSARKQQAVICD